MPPGAVLVFVLTLVQLRGPSRPKLTRPPPGHAAATQPQVSATPRVPPLVSHPSTTALRLPPWMARAWLPAWIIIRVPSRVRSGCHLDVIWMPSGCHITPAPRPAVESSLLHPPLASLGLPWPPLASLLTLPWRPPVAAPTARGIAGGARHGVSRAARSSSATAARDCAHHGAPHRAGVPVREFAISGLR